MADCLFECLREARLEHHYPKLEANGITTADTLSKLTMNDYATLGMNSMEDKKRLFRLIQIIKAVQGPGPHQPPRSLGQGQSRQQTSHPQSQNKDTTRNRIHEAKTMQRSNCDTKVKADHDSSRESNKENVDVPKPRERVQVVMRTIKGAGTSEKKQKSEATKSTSSPAKSDASATTTKGLNIVTQDNPSKPDGPAFVERIVHNTGYNYGLPNSAAKPKTNSSASGVRAEAESKDEKIKVCVRKRPLSKREVKKKDGDVVRIENCHTVVLVEPKVAVDLTKFTQEHAFIFDEVFNENMTNREVYECTAKQLINCVFNRGMATCFVYGQTGAGKTHTIMGNLEVPGLYLLAAQDIFNKISAGEEMDVTIWVSYFEIYCGQLFDLLNKRKRLHVREDGSQRVNIAGLCEVELDNVQTLMEAVQHGNKVRSTGTTGVNADSSRSHAILQIELRNSKKERIGKISFIDLAGSERAADVTDTDKQNRLEGAEINQSLLALKECIRALDQESRHTPFRQSKLTHILKDSFIGNCRTCMIANISPCQSASENTLNTLRYADRVKELRKDLSPKVTPHEDAANSSKSAVTKEFPAVNKATPSVFHPSTVPLSSTPLRPNKTNDTKSAKAEQQIGYLQYESPICGHKIRPRKLVSALAAEEDKTKDVPVKQSPRKIAAKFDAEKETDLNMSLTSDKGVSKVPSKSRENKNPIAGKVGDLNGETAMDISVGSLNISADSRSSHSSRASRRDEKVKENGRHNDGAGAKKVPNVRPSSEVKSKQVQKTYIDSPLNLSVLKQEKFDKQTGLIARLEKAMEKTREALNRSLTSHDLINTSDMEGDDVLSRGDEAPLLSDKFVKVEGAKLKSGSGSKVSGMESSPVLVEKVSKPTFMKNSVKSFVQVAQNSPVTKEKMAKLVQAQKDGKKLSIKKISRSPTKKAVLPKPDPKVMEGKVSREPDLDTSQEVSPSKRRRVVSPAESQTKTSTDFDDYLAKALHDTGNKRNKFQVYEGKLFPNVQGTEDKSGNNGDKPSTIDNCADVDAKRQTGVEISTGADARPVQDVVDGVPRVAVVDQNVSNESLQKSPNLVKRSLLSEFKEDIVTDVKSPITKAFLSPRKMNSGVRLDLINSFSPMKRFDAEKGQSVSHAMSRRDEAPEKSRVDDKMSTNSKPNVEKSPDMRRPKLLDRDTGDLYTMSQSPQKSPRMGAIPKTSPRATLGISTLGHLSEASKKISSLPTPDEFLKSLAGKRSSLRKSKGQRSDDVPRSECLDRPKVIVDDQPKSESGSVRKERRLWDRPPVKPEPRNPKLLAPKQRPKCVKPEATKRLSLTNMLDSPPAAEKLDSESHQSDLIQDFYSKFLKYSSKDKAMKEKNSDLGEKLNDVCSTMSDSALLRKRVPRSTKSDTDCSERIPGLSRTVTDSGVVLPSSSESKNIASTLKDFDDDDAASIATLDDVSSIASVKSLPVNEEFREDTREVTSEPLPPLPTVDLQKTACSAWKKTAPVKPKPVKPQPKLHESPKKGSKVTKKVTCTAPMRSEKLKPDPLSSFLPIHPYPVTPSSNDVLTAPKVITKIVVSADDSKDKTMTSENLDDSEIVRAFDDTESYRNTNSRVRVPASSDAKMEKTTDRADLVNSLSTIGLALQRGKLDMVRELSKSTNSSRLNRNNSCAADPLSKTIGYSSYRDKSAHGTLKTEPERVHTSKYDSRKPGNDQSRTKSYSEKDPLRSTIGVSSGKYLKNSEALSSKNSKESYSWRDHGHDKIDLGASLESNSEARQQLGESLRSTYDSVRLRSTLDRITSTIDGSALREKSIAYHSRHSTVESSKSDTDGRKSHSNHARLRVISGHEEHLADVTAMCRKEMTLLKQIRSGEVSFSDYTNRMTDILLIKLKSIELLRDRIARCKIMNL